MHFSLQAIEPVRAREGIDPVTGQLFAAPCLVLPLIEKDIAECVARFAGCSEDTRVVALGKELAPSLEEPVEPPSQSDLEALHPASERDDIGCLDQEVKVVADDDEMDHAKVRPVAARLDRALDDAKGAVPPQRWDTIDDPQRDVKWKARGEPFASPVRHRRPAARPSSTRTPSAQAGRPTRIVQLQLAPSLSK